MTTLHLIRHGRASAMEADYDKLHTMGEAQARLLGEHFARVGQRFDAVYVGPLRRQLDTLRLMRESSEPSGLRWPDASVLDGLAEGPFEVLFKQYLRPRIKLDETLQGLLETLKAAPDDGAREVAMDAMFERMVALWRAGDVAGEDLEPAASFDARVTQAKEIIAEREGAGRSVAVVTSNGVIGSLFETAAREAPAAGRARHRFYNTSVSVLELAGSTARLHRRNATEHIADPALLTML